MTVNARTEEFQHVELLGKYALFTNGRIDRSTVPEGWYCYDFRGSDDDPGELRYIEESVAVNHAGSILMPEKLEFPASGRLDARDEFGFLDEGEMTLHEFCEVHDLPYRCCLRCCPSSGSSSADLICYDLDVQRQNMAREKSPVGRVTYVGGDVLEFTDAEAFLTCLREELPFSSTTGFRYKVLANDPSIREAVDDIAYDFYGEENPRESEDYEPQQDMTLGGM